MVSVSVLSAHLCICGLSVFYQTLCICIPSKSRLSSLFSVPPLSLLYPFSQLISVSVVPAIYASESLLCLSSIPSSSRLCYSVFWLTLCICETSVSVSYPHGSFPFLTEPPVYIQRRIFIFLDF